MGQAKLIFSKKSKILKRVRSAIGERAFRSLATDLVDSALKDAMAENFDIQSAAALVVILLWKNGPASTLLPWSESDSTEPERFMHFSEGLGWPKAINLIDEGLRQRGVILHQTLKQSLLNGIADEGLRLLSEIDESDDKLGAKLVVTLAGISECLRCVIADETEVYRNLKSLFEGEEFLFQSSYSLDFLSREAERYSNKFSNDSRNYPKTAVIRNFLGAFYGLTLREDPDSDQNFFGLNEFQAEHKMLEDGYSYESFNGYELNEFYLEDCSKNSIEISLGEAWEANLDQWVDTYAS